MHYKCHESNPNHGGSYKVSPDSIKDKKNNNKSYQFYPKKDNKCFQHVVTVALNHEEVKKDP